MRSSIRRRLDSSCRINPRVAIRPSAGTLVDDELLANIRNAVAAFKVGLDPGDVTIVNLETAEPVDENLVYVARNDGPFLTWVRGHLNQIVQATVVLLAIALVVGVFRDLFHQDEPPPNADRPAQDLSVYAPAVKKQSTEVESQTPETSPERSDSFAHADLTELVREHPQAASAMLKTWVKEAS